MTTVALNNVFPRAKSVTLEGKNKKRLGILGGTFNPPHLGHLVLAEQVGKQLGLDRVLFMPSNIPPHKKTTELASPQNRREMIERAIEGNDLFAFEGIEFERTGKSYTIDTIDLLQQKYPQHELYFIIGGDMAASLSNWHRINELMEMVHFVAVKRPGYPVVADHPVIWVDSPELGISSSEIRDKIRTGCTVRYLVPQHTLDYIEQKRLYI